jgi:hypothetical protein
MSINLFANRLGYRKLHLIRNGSSPECRKLRIIKKELALFLSIRCIMLFLPMNQAVPS